MVKIKSVEGLQSALDESVTIDVGLISDVESGDIPVFSNDESKGIEPSGTKLSDLPSCDLGGYANEVVTIKTDNTRQLKPSGFVIGAGTASGSRVWPSNVFGNAALKTITISTSSPSGGSDGDIWFKISS